MKLIYTQLLLILLVFNTTSAQTILPAVISQNTTLLKQNSPYVINSSTLVSDNITLTIEAGVDLTINGALNVRGIILAFGAANDSIHFHCNNLNAPSIRIVKGTNDTLNIFSKFEYCSITSNNIGIYGFNRKLEIRNSSINNCLSDGLFIENGALRVFQTKIERNGGRGIYTNSTQPGAFQVAVDSCYINKSSISNNSGIGVDWSLNGTFDITKLSYNVSFSENKINGNGKEGIKLFGNAHTVHIYDNFFTENKSFAISLGINGDFGNPFTFVFNNFFVRNNGVLGTNIPHSSEIWNNIIFNNFVNTSNTNGNGSGKPEVFDIKFSSIFFHNNIVNNNQFENLFSFTDDSNYDSLSLKRNLFYNNKPLNTFTCSSFYLDPQTWNQQSWDKFNFTNNNYFLDETSSYWIKNEFRTSDIIVANNYKSTSKGNFDGVNGFYGFVYEIDPLNDPDIDAPISPVKYVIVDTLGSKYIIWKQNPEKDLKGYKIYYGKVSDFEYSHYLDVGMKNIFLIPNEISFFTDFTVTAYDKDADGLKDFFEGHESWFSDEQVGPGILITKDNELLQSPVSTCLNQTYKLKAIGNCNSIIWNNGSTSKDLTINNLAQDTNYYFDCINSSPITYSIRSEIVTIKVNPSQVSLSQNYPDGIVQKFNAQKIESNSTFGSDSNVLFQGVRQITLEPGFYFNGPKSFTGEIADCPN